MPSFVSIDVETANTDAASICQIGMARFKDGEIIDSFNRLVNPETHFLPINISIHGIKPDDVKSAPRFFELFDEVNEWLLPNIVTSHSYFDRSAIFRAIKRDLLPEPQYQWLDATTIIRRTWKEFAQRGYGLGNLARHFEIEFSHHDACEDARVSGEILVRAIRESDKSIEDWRDILRPKRSGY